MKGLTAMLANFLAALLMTALTLGIGLIAGWLVGDEDAPNRNQNRTRSLRP